MTNTMTIRLKPAIIVRLEQKRKELKTTSEAVINKALEDYFYFERLNALRQEVKEQAKKQGFGNEDDIFNAIS